jgi:hypothetical protein
MSLIKVPANQQRPAGSGGAHRGGKKKRSPFNASGKRKWKSPPAGRGQYVNPPNSPHWSHNKANPKFWRNAAINNPSHAALGAAVVGAAGLQSQRKNMTPREKNATDVATAGVAAGGATKVLGHQREYRKLRAAQHPKNNTDWADPKDVRNPAKTLPKEERKKFEQAKSGARKAQSEAGGSKRIWTQHFNANFPEGYKTSAIRRAVATGKTTRNVNRATLAVGALGAGAAYGAQELKQKHHFGKRALMSDAEIRRRKKLQGQISHTTSTMGLSALGVTGAAALAARKPGVLRAVQKIPKLHNVTPQKMKETAVTTGLISGGIGGVGGYNFAAYTGAESRKRKLAPVKKGMYMGLEMGHYGEEGHPVELPEIKVPIEKAWTPVANNYDSEGARHKRAKGYQGAALVGSGAAGAYAASEGTKAVKTARKLKVIPKAGELRDQVQTKGGSLATRVGKPFRALDYDVVKPALKHGGKALTGAAAAGAAVGAHRALKRKEQGSWQPYAKRDNVSAFGVDHTE